MFECFGLFQTWLDGKRIAKNEEVTLSPPNSADGNDDDEDEKKFEIPTKTSPLQLFFAQKGPFKYV